MEKQLYIFDMGGVVVRNFDVFPEIYHYLKLSKEEFYRLSGDFFELLSDGKISVSQFWQSFSRNYGSPIGQDLFKTFFRPEMNLEVVTKITELKHRARVVCGTNTIECHYQFHLQRGDYAIFDKIYASNKIGISKPNPDFFRYILKEERMPAAKCCFIDDNEENVSIAAELGLKAVLYTGRDSLAKIES